MLNLNEEFDTNPIGALFVNSSHGIGSELSQVGLNGPGIFSVSGLGAEIGVSLSETLLVKLG